MKQAYLRLWPYMRRYKRALVLGLGALALKDAFAAAQPFIIGYSIDSLTRSFSVRAAVYFAALLIVVSLIKGLFQYWMRVILIGMSRDVEFDLRNDIFRGLTRMSSDFFVRYRTGDIMVRTTNDLNAVRMMLGPGFMYWSETMLTFVFAIAVMISVDLPLALVAIAPTPVISFAVIFFGRKIHDRFESIQARFSDISSRVQENLAGVRVIRAYTQEDAELERFSILNRSFVEHNIRLARLSGMFMPSLQALIGIGFLCVLWAGGQRVLSGSITIGEFVMFNTYMGLLVWPMIALGWVVNLMQRGIASLNRIVKMIDEQPLIAEPASPIALHDPRGSIEFDNVAVSIDGRSVLSDVSLQIEAGSTIAIVGHTGSGKSTLVHLIPRLMDPTSGRVLFDGHDVRDLSPAALRRQIGIVTQETFLFSSTLAENIAFGVESATADQIRRAAELAGLGPDLETFPNGLDTMIGERGLTLSGGQKQRTAIARAILREPRVLILDDALSSVDTLTEERILSSLQELMRGRTTILISHRVSTVRGADQIYVLEHGSIVEQGDHDALVGQGGYYADLYEKQLLEEELEAI